MVRSPRLVVGRLRGAGGAVLVALCLLAAPSSAPGEDAPAGAPAPPPAPPAPPAPAPGAPVPPDAAAPAAEGGGLDDDLPSRPRGPAVDRALGDPSLSGDEDPTAPPAPDPRRPIEGKLPFGPEQRMTLETDDVVGRMKFYESDDKTAWIAVLAGNPHLYGGDYSVKSRTLVLWLSKDGASDLGDFFGAMAVPGASGSPPKPPKPAEPAADAPPAKPSSPRPGPAAGPGAAAGPSRFRDVIPPSIVAIYAEGAVEFTAGLHTFRAMQLVFEPKTGHMLVVEARYDGAIEAGTGTEARLVPVFVRAQRARGLAHGFVTFDGAELTTSRANDRIALQVRTLTIEEYGQAVADEPVVLGFARPGTQRFEGTGIDVRAERVPIAHVPKASFGGDDVFSELPVRLRRASIGSRSSLGRFGFVGFGGVEGGPEPWFDWTVDVGGYTKRGPAVGTDAIWTRPKVKGRWQTFSMYDATGNDRTGFDAGEGYRGMSWLENRFDPTPAWRFDLEANVFSDRGVHREYYEADARTHKDRSTYGRVRWMEGGAAATLTAGAHLRDYATETFAQPEVAFWSESVPLPSPASGPAFDLSSEARAGWMVRRFDEADADEGYEAWRVDVTERVYAPFSVGDVRVSPFVGGHWTSYTERTDGGDDLERGALEAGVRANLQLWKDFGAWGGPWSLDGLRHVLDLDVGGYGRFLDDTDPDDAPYFDRIDGERDRTAVFAEVRSRVLTRRAMRRDVGRVREDVTLLDARMRVSMWPEQVGPYGRTGTGDVEGWLAAEIVPRKAWLEGTLLSELDGPTLRRASVGVQWMPTEDFAIACGLRNVKDELFGPWIDAYWRWSEKWGVRFAAVEDFERRGDGAVRITLMRFSPDHLIEGGPIVRDAGRDVGFYFNVAPSIGGRPVREPFQPREIFALEAATADSR